MPASGRKRRRLHPTVGYGCDTYAFCFMVDAGITGKTARFNVTARETQLVAIDRLAHHANRSRSAFLIQAALKAADPMPQVTGPRPQKRRSAA